MNYYDILEVDKSASQKQIKLAYINKVKIYTNEKHPEEFKMIRKAYNTLSNDESRSNYDNEMMRDDLYDKLQNSAIQAFNNERYSAALELFEEMEERYPEDEQVKIHLCQCRIDMDHTHEATKIINEQLNKQPKSEVWLNLASVLKLQQEEYEQARKFTVDLISINPSQASYFELHARTYRGTGDFKEATNIIQKYFKQNELTVENFELLMFQLYDSINADKHTVHDDTEEKIVSFTRNEKNKDVLLNLMMEVTENLGPNDYCYKDFIRIIKKMNNNEYEEVSTWVLEAERKAYSDASYYPDVYSGSDSNYNYDQNSDSERHDPTGSILWSVIFGIILSFIFTPLVGIPAGFIWYFFAESIKTFIAGLGCVLIILLVIAGFVSGVL